MVETVPSQRAQSLHASTLFGLERLSYKDVVELPNDRFFQSAELRDGLHAREVSMAFLRDAGDRYFEDYIEGDVHDFGWVEVDEDEIISFARRYDPQPIHTAPDAAKLGPFGGVIASGWHTAGLMMRLYAEHYLSNVASLVSPGVDELRWHKPVRPGDRLSVRVTILKATASKSRPDRGIVTSFVEVFNQSTELVMSLRVVNIILRRNTA